MTVYSWPQLRSIVLAELKRMAQRDVSPQFWPADTTYACFSEEFVLRQAPNEYLLVMSRWLGQRTPKWMERHDCDNHARTFHTVCNGLHGGSDEGDAQSGAMTTLWYNSETLGGIHAINGWISAPTGDTRPTLRFFEPAPQTCREISLKDSEVASIYYMYW